MDLEGENFVILSGKICKPNFKELENNNYMFKASLAIPTEYDKANQYIKIAAWGKTAELLGYLKTGTFIRIHGHIEESSFNGQCRHCKGPQKIFWTEVLVDNFIIKEMS